ncbi:MAG TPA: quinone-dependent dihydroorotate dehydrogenase [Verrucomicrobiae bacterium]|nr:quinone-dependent dihydroorotate dehydrogenase [Verrucomicrobiae bacterium]
MLGHMLYKALLRPWLFQADPEAAHERALNLAASMGRRRIARDAIETVFALEDRRLRQTVFGIEFPNPVGLAAGYDKNAVGLDFWAALGFGFVEIGSVTFASQPGNEPPRVFRQPRERALVNRMGFNNDGAESIAARVPPRPHRIPIAVNVGKNRDVDLARAGENYAATIDAFRDRADFFVINVSSPNTPGLRKLQDKEMLDELLRMVVGRAPPRGETGTPAGGSGPTTAPILLKIAPDLTFDQIDDAVGLVEAHKLAGIVATNTTTDHPTPPEGGLSGAPLRARATECIRHIRRQTQGRVPIVGVGGIFTAADAYEKIRAGACLVEIWTGMIYEGPFIVRNINRGLLRLLERDGFGTIADAVGTE